MSLSPELKRWHVKSLHALTPVGELSCHEKGPTSVADLRNGLKLCCDWFSFNLPASKMH